MHKLEEVTSRGLALGWIIRSDYSESGIKFITPGEYSQQLGYMKRESGYVVSPHVHNVVERKVHLTQEVLFVRRGLVRVDFFDNSKNYLMSKVLGSGDVVLLADGGHGVTMLEESEIVEVKQGPYLGDQDKVRFEYDGPIRICQ